LTVAVSLNETIADLLRLGESTTSRQIYPYHPPAQGDVSPFSHEPGAKNTKPAYWGEWYKTGDRITKASQLSLTFHKSSSYLKATSPDWPKVIDTTWRSRTSDTRMAG